MSDNSHPPPPDSTVPIASGSNADPAPPHIHNIDAQVVPVAEPTPTVDRVQLVERARNFLYSPQVRYENNAAKYKFLAEKGLDDIEIYGLLHELPVQAPVIPPRTYPQPPPSNLPGVFLGLARVFSWVAGGSLAVLMVYFRYIYPRLSKSYEARLSLRAHQKHLLSRLSTPLSELRSIQAETFAILPVPDPYKEHPKFRDCHTLENLYTASQTVEDIPPLSVLRCALEELGSRKETAVTTELLFETIEAKNAWIGSEEGVEYTRRIWDCLTSAPLFQQNEVDGQITWTYAPPTPLPRPPVEVSLESLQASLSPSESGQPRFQHTLQALSDLTGYLTAQIYDIPSNFRLGLAGNALSPEAEEARREIRALKGLVLNRRSFMPSPRSQLTMNSNGVPA